MVHCFNICVEQGDILVSIKFLSSLKNREKEWPEEAE